MTIGGRRSARTGGGVVADLDLCGITDRARKKLWGWQLSFAAVSSIAGGGAADVAVDDRVYR